MTDLFNPVASDVDASCLNHLRFTSSVLAEDMEVTGICTVELQLQLQLASGAASTAAAGPIGADSSHTHGGSPGHGHGPGHGPDHGYGHGPGDGASLRGLGHTDLDRNGDVYVSLQCVQENGSAAYVTEGCLRLKHRKFELAANLLRRGLSASQAALERIPHQLPAPYLPVRTYESCDVAGAGVTAAPVIESVLIEMLPTSFLFKKGQRVRLALYGADVGHFQAGRAEPFDLRLWTGLMTSVSPGQTVVQGDAVTVTPHSHAVVTGSDRVTEEGRQQLLSGRSINFSRLMLPVIDRDILLAV